MMSYFSSAMLFHKSRKLLGVYRLVFYTNGHVSCRHNKTKLSDAEQTHSKTVTDDVLPLSAVPGPGGLKNIPYIGTALLFKPFSQFSLETFGKFVCDMHDRYGQVFKVRLGKDYTVFTSNVKDIEKIFWQEPKFPQRRLMNLSRIYRERRGLPQSLGSCHGEEWYALRKPLNVTLKRPKAIQSYIPALENVAEDFIERLLEVKGDNQSERAEEMFKLFFKFSSEGIGVICFNHRLGFLARDLNNCPEKNKLLEAFQVSVSSTFRDMLGLERRYMKTEKDKFYQNYHQAMNYIRQQSMLYVNKVLSESRGEGRSRDDAHTKGDDCNLLKTLVQRKDLNMEHILAIIDSLLIGGTDSTARTLTVLLYDMARSPDIQTRLARDIRAVTGPNGTITAKCFDQVRLLRACVKESMRVHFPVPGGVERILTSDTVISGYHIPSGTNMLMTGIRTCMDPTHFPNPTEYIPERWLRQPDVQTTEHDGQTGSHDYTPSSSQSAFAFIPFGHGARSCIGHRFAETELMVGLAKVLQNVHVSVHPSYKSLEIKHTPFVTPITPIPFVFTRRS